MAMTDDEKRMLFEAIEAHQAIGLALGAVMTVLNEEIPTLRQRALEKIAVASALPSATETSLGTPRSKLLSMAAQFIASLDDLGRPH